MKKRLFIILILIMLSFSSCFLFEDKIFIELTGLFSKGENVFLRGGQFQINWSAPDYISKVHIDLMRGDNLLIERIADNVDNSGFFLWTISKELEIANDYYIRIFGTEIQSIKNPEDRTDGNFSLIDLEITSPTSQSIVETGYPFTIKWNPIGDENINLRYMLKNINDDSSQKIFYIIFSKGECEWIVNADLSSGEYCIQFYDPKNYITPNQDITYTLDSEPFNITVGKGSKWEQLSQDTPLDTRYYYSSLVYDNKIWVIGGHELIENPDGSTDRLVKNDAWYSTNGVTWIQATGNMSMPPRSGAEAVVFNDNMYIMGGLGSNGLFYNDVWVSSDGVTWTEATDNAGWLGRRSFGSAVYDGKIWIMAGLGYSNDYYNDVWNSTDGYNWIEVSNYNQWHVREGLEVAVFDGKMWVIGGSKHSDNSLSDIWNTTNGIDWEVISDYNLWDYRKGHQVLVYNNRLWIMGGYNYIYKSKHYYNDIWHSEDGINWYQVLSSSHWYGRVGFGAVVFKDDIYVMGGYNSNLSVDDVWKTNNNPNY